MRINSNHKLKRLLDFEEKEEKIYANRNVFYERGGKSSCKSVGKDLETRGYFWW